MLRGFDRTETNSEKNFHHLALIAIFLWPRRAASQYSSEGNARL
jgi:hypothetical protein